MAFSAEDRSKIEALIAEIGNFDQNEYVCADRARRIDAILEEYVGGGQRLNIEMARECAEMYAALACACDGVSRGAIDASIRYYDKAIKLVGWIFLDTKEVLPSAIQWLLEAARVRNLYGYDDCPYLKILATKLYGEKAENAINSIIKANLLQEKSDPVENTPEYLAVIDEVEAKIKALNIPLEFGSCHKLWAYKKQYLAEYGIVWHSPAELNPNVEYF